MAYLVRIICWDHCHMNEIPLTKKQIERLPHKVETGKAVCPDCRNEGHGNKPFAIVNAPDSIGGNTKPFQCRHGHLTLISAFAHSMFHVRFGSGREDFENVPGNVEELAELIDSKDISCHHTVDAKGNQRPCNCKLKPLDDTLVTTPGSIQFKTKTRIGDLWDKAGLEPVRPSQYDKDGNVQESKTDRANRERLRRMRERNRNVAEERLPGRVLDRPTSKTYRRRDRNSIDFND